MNCSACGALNPDGKRFCAECGATLPVACPSCGSSNAPSKKFCGDCGHALQAASTPTADADQQAAPFDAERRQLTVMFCDLVGSTALASRLDPEDLQSVLRRYHAAVTAAVTPYEGHVAQLLGDGVLVYFGYPRAHEDDATRAVRAAFVVVHEVAALQLPGDVALQTRIGIATGLVVVGEIGTGTPAAERSASGETPNLAARLQALAGPGEVVLSEQTRRLLGGSFELQSLGRLELKGFPLPVEAWRVLGERAVASRFEAQHEREVTALIGRDSEVALLLDRWSMAREAEGQVLLLSGEAGIGKSRICQALRERLAGEPHATVLLQCSPYFNGSALYPVVQHLQRAAGIASADAPQARSRKLEQLAGTLPSTSLGALLRVMGLPDDGHAPANKQTPQQEKAHALRALVEMLRQLSLQQPVLMLVEDAHWIDPTTEELIALAVDQLRDSRVLTMITCRPEYSPSWGSPAQWTRLTLIRLGQRQCAALIDAVALGKALPAEVQAEIIRKTDGVPLFVEELTKTVLQSGLLEETAEGYRLVGPLPELAIPSTLQDSLMARLDRLAPAKGVAQAGAAIGREFSRRLLEAVLQAAPARLDEALADLVKAELLVRRGIEPETTYTFKHALVRDAAYNSMLKSQRVLRHRQIADALEQTEPETVATRPELLAHHHQEAGNTAQAIEAWTRAGKRAVAGGANREAVAAFERALALLDGVPATTQTMSDALDIRIAVGPALVGVYGAGARQTEASYSKALELAEGLGDRPRLFTALWGLCYINFQRGRYAESVQAGQRLLAVARDSDDSGQLVEAHHALWTPLIHMGRAADALDHLDQADALYDMERHASLRYHYAGHDPAACCAAHRSITSWILGFPERASREVGKALARIQELQHPMTNILLGWAAWVPYHRGEHAMAGALAERMLPIAERHGFLVYVGGAAVLAELARGTQPTTVRLEQLERRVVGSPMSKAIGMFMRCVLVDLYAAAGDVESALRLLASSAEGGYDHMHGAELHHLEGALLLQRSTADAGAAERCFHKAIEIACQQGAKSFELRAATSLAMLWAQRGQRDEARRLLGDAYGWFTEGFDTADLKRAKALLDELGGPLD